MNILITQKTRTEDSSATYQRTRLYVSEDNSLIPIAVINQKIQKDSMAAAKRNVHTAVCHIAEMQYVIKSVSLWGSLRFLSAGRKSKGKILVSVCYLHINPIKQQ
jgi:hypothetical protein